MKIFQKVIKTVGTAQYNECLWIGKDHSEDKVSFYFNDTVFNLVTDCDFEFKFSYAINFTIKINNEKHDILGVLDTTRIIAVKGLKKISICL